MTDMRGLRIARNCGQLGLLAAGRGNPAWANDGGLTPSVPLSLTRYAGSG